MKINKRRCRKFRNIAFNPAIECFKPCGIPMSELESIKIETDEIESIRLLDYEGLYQEEAAEKMQISRTTLSRTVDAARKKVADAILNGKSLIIIKTKNQVDDKNLDTE